MQQPKSSWGRDFPIRFGSGSLSHKPMWGLHAGLASAQIDIDIPLFFGAKKRDYSLIFISQTIRHKSGNSEITFYLQISLTKRIEKPTS